MKSFGEMYLENFLDAKKKQKKAQEDSYERLEKNYRKALRESNIEQAETLKKILDAVDSRRRLKKIA